MKAFVIGWLKPPIFDTDEQTLTAFYLNLVILLACLGICLSFLAFVLVDGLPSQQYISLSFGFVSTIFLKIMLNQKRLDFVKQALLFLVWAAVMVAPILDVGIYSISMSGFVLLITLSGILSHRTMPIYTTAASIASAIFIVFLMRLGIVNSLPQHQMSIEAALVSYTVIYSIAGVATYASSTTVYHVIERLRQSQSDATQTAYSLKRAEHIAQVGNYQFDIETQKLTWSDEMYRIFGIAPETPVTFESYGRLIPEDAYDNVMENVQKATETGEPYEIEHSIILSDGTVKEIFAIGNPVVDENGDYTKIFGIVKDITERKQAERIQQVLLNISNTRHTSDNLETLLQKMIAQLGNVLNVKNCYIALYDERTGKYSFPYGTDEYDTDWSPQPMSKSLTEYVRRTGEPQLITEAKHLRMVSETDVEFIGTWSKVWVGAPLRAHQRVIGVIAVQDYDDANAYQQSDLDLLTYVGQNIGSIIESKQAEQEHLDLELQLQKNEFLQEFIGHMTHDIKTPLSVIKNSTYLLKNVRDTSRQSEYIERIDYQLERLDRIVEDILTISRLDHVDQSSYITINLKGLIEHIANQLYPKVQRSKIDLQLELADNLPIFMGNESDLTRAFLNLVENAIHYSDKGGQVMVRAYVDNDEIVCQIEDTGIGIAPDDLPYIFDRFYRADNARDFERGTGLGLAIVKRVFELHHGDIEVSSALDDGTTFTVRMRITELTRPENIINPQLES